VIINANKKRGVEEEPGQVHPEGLDFSEHAYVYYVHYMEWDRRMDEWVTRDRLVLAVSIEQIKHAIMVQDVEVPDEQQMEVEGGDNDERKDKSKGGKAPAGERQGNATGKLEKFVASGKGGAPSGGNAHGAHGDFTDEDVRAHEEATKVCLGLPALLTRFSR
jgi:hypothetical protein